MLYSYIKYSKDIYKRLKQLMQKIIRVDEENDAIIRNLSADCYVLNAALDEDFCLRFAAAAMTMDKVFLFYGDNAVAACQEYEADGVLVDLGTENLRTQVFEIRKKLGKDKYVGLITRNRRHESMLVSEAEPDFVVFKVWREGFGQVKELIDWYQEFFLIQSAAWVMDDDVPITDLNTDFVVVKA